MIVDLATCYYPHRSPWLGCTPQVDASACKARKCNLEPTLCESHSSDDEGCYCRVVEVGYLVEAAIS